jgi:hypothetical protein
MPVLLDLRQVPVGSWAEYTVSQGGRLPRTVRQALVDRDKSSATVELVMEVKRRRAPQPEVTVKKIIRMVVDLGLDANAPKETVLQRADGDPIALPADFKSGRKRLFKLDPKRSLGNETVVVSAGTFETQHHQDVSPRGGTIDIWASTQVAPFGLVRMERKPGPNAPAKRAKFGHVTYALARSGTGATTVITKPVKPADALMQCRSSGPKPFKQ